MRLRLEEVLIATGAPFPRSRFYGFDPHEASLVAARAHAEDSGVADRIEFARGTAKTLTARDFDLICFFDCLHDLGDPVGAAIAARQELAKDGTVLAVEPLAALLLRLHHALLRALPLRGNRSASL